MDRLTRIAGIICCLAIACAAAPEVRAADYPSRPIHLVISYQPGGIVDFAGRVLAQQLGAVLGQSIVVDNRPGAGGIVGVDSVAHAAPDGYDLVLIDPSIVTNPVLHKKMPFDVFKDLAPISLVGSSPDVLVVAPQLKIKTFAALVAYGKANPGKLNSPRLASAPPATSPAKCSSSGSTSTPPTCPTKARAPRSSMS